MGRLEGRTAIVTGAARGIGAEIARTFVAEGAHVLLGDVLHEAGEKTAASLGAAARYEPLDVSREEDWERVVARVLSERGRIDVLVNNAAILHIGSIDRTTPEVFRRIHDVNTLGPFLGMRAVVGPMRQQGRGSIVNISSIDGLMPLSCLTAYAASKWGLRGLTKSAAIELGRQGIRVNCVSPASGNDEMAAAWNERLAEAPDQVEAYANDRGIPGAVPLELTAQAVLFLATDASAHCTGIDLPVDGGASIGRYIEVFERV